MEVQVTNDSGAVIWARGNEKGISCRAYLTDGTQQAIITALQSALEQAQAELGLLDEADRVRDSGATAA
jgi:hypothetical protein